MKSQKACQKVEEEKITYTSSEPGSLSGSNGKERKT